MEENLLYSTHLDLLGEIFNFTGPLKNAVEFGMGDYSTGFLLNRNENLISIEMQYDYWYNKMVETFGNYSDWTPVLSIGPNKVFDLKYPENIDFCFVDGHGDSRPECINFMLDKKCPIIVAHDTERDSYGWERVKETDYLSFTLKKYKNWTTIWTNNVELHNHLKNIFV